MTASLASPVAAPLVGRPRRTGAGRPAATPMPDAEDARSRRAFVEEMLDRNALAFSSELDVQAMMHVYPARF